MLAKSPCNTAKDLGGGKEGGGGGFQKQNKQKMETKLCVFPKRQEKVRIKVSKRIMFSRIRYISFTSRKSNSFKEK